MRFLILGGTGLLGQALAAEAHCRSLAFSTAARTGADLPLDVRDGAALERILSTRDYGAVINCAALVDAGKCESDPQLAWGVNARPLSFLADWSRRTGGTLVQISTDHFFPGNGPQRHDELAGITLLNEYARSKHAGEAIAMTAPRALVVRTSIVGYRGWPIPTFAEFAYDVVENDRAAALFSDVFTSSIDVRSLARHLFDLVGLGVVGVLNVGATEVYSKERFILEMASQRGRRLTAARSSSGAGQVPRRPLSLGLDVRRAEALLGCRLPTLPEVVASVLEQMADGLHR